ncbi:MAG: aspartate carbamoyltransferase [Candidatus Lokiarchaeota archaeon]|nr:aspartate carbamoyltransferase [Candidatus Lokiarchaeota archaeon]MBD3200428.1 aspartate carbamoyltransferase [Candidatus Lokiarchaeota archaeon]
MFQEKFREGIVSARDFNREDIEYILKKGQEMIKVKNLDILKGKILATLFFEPSTRTRLSFESAMHRLGGSVIGFQSGDVSSIKKGESLADTIRTVENYSDCIVIRHPMEGSAKLASRFAKVPIINAGSGSKEHPTQALLDLLTITEEVGELDGLNIGIMGDLKYGRTVHSLAILLSNFDVNVYFISPEELRMRNRYKDYLYHERRMKFKELSEYRKILDVLDVLYMTRIQKERFADLEEYERVKDIYVFTQKDLKNTKENFKLLHPLPRVNEISPEIDKSEKAIYFKQTHYGLQMRKAILAELMRD